MRKPWAKALVDSEEPRSWNGAAIMEYRRKVEARHDRGPLGNPFSKSSRRGPGSERKWDMSRWFRLLGFRSRHTRSWLHPSLLFGASRCQLILMMPSQRSHALIL